MYLPKMQFIWLVLILMEANIVSSWQFLNLHRISLENTWPIAIQGYKELPHILTGRSTSYEEELDCGDYFLLIEGSCYFAHCPPTPTDNEFTWVAARDECKTMEADLATFDSSHQFLSVKQYVSALSIGCNYWIGGEDILPADTTQDVWKWIDGEPMPTDSPFWATDGMGTGLIHAILDMNKDYQISAVDAAAVNTPLCEKAPKPKESLHRSHNSYPTQSYPSPYFHQTSQYPHNHQHHIPYNPPHYNPYPYVVTHTYEPISYDNPKEEVHESHSYAPPIYATEVHNDSLLTNYTTHNKVKKPHDSYYGQDEIVINAHSYGSLSQSQAQSQSQSQAQSQAEAMALALALAFAQSQSQSQSQAIALAQSQSQGQSESQSQSETQAQIQSQVQQQMQQQMQQNLQFMLFLLTLQGNKEKPHHPPKPQPYSHHHHPHDHHYHGYGHHDKHYGHHQAPPPAPQPTNTHGIHYYISNAPHTNHEDKHSHYQHTSSPTYQTDHHSSSHYSDKSDLFRSGFRTPGPPPKSGPPKIFHPINVANVALEVKKMKESFLKEKTTPVLPKDNILRKFHENHYSRFPSIVKPNPFGTHLPHLPSSGLYIRGSPSTAGLKPLPLLQSPIATLPYTNSQIINHEPNRKQLVPSQTKLMKDLREVFNKARPLHPGFNPNMHSTFVGR